MRAARLVFWLALLGVAGPALLAPTPVYADDEDDEYETAWLGAKLGIWHRPSFDMKVQVSGEQPTNPLFGLIGSNFDIHNELGVGEGAGHDRVERVAERRVTEQRIFVVDLGALPDRLQPGVVNVG